ncbi:hypothetical protein [Halorubrum trapanicum]|uniref:hypothetical protein n=1 Tax=Halorubrum trapanicum TaxID=29284 RepID=UPI000BBAD0A5|nr:hypothetical protein [Halorubrum trapanicum]
MGVTDPSRPEESAKSRHAQRLLTIGEGLLVGAIIYGAFVFIFETTGGQWSTGERLILVLLGALLFGIGRVGFLAAPLRDVSSEQKRAKIRRWQRSVVGAILIAGGLIVIHLLVVRPLVVVLFFGSLALGVILSVLGLWVSPTIGTTTEALE